MNQPPYGSNANGDQNGPPGVYPPSGSYAFAQPVQRVVAMPLATARTASKLGIWSLLLGPFAGLPAIVVGQRALAEIDAQPAAFSNRDEARLGIVLGWGSSALWSYFVTSAVAAGSVATCAACALVALGFVAAYTSGRGANAAGPLRALSAGVGRARGPVFTVLAVVMLGTVRGGVKQWEDRRAAIAARDAAAKLCADSRTTLSRALGKEDFITADSALSTSRSSCGASAATELAAVGDDLTKREADYKQRVTLEKAAAREQAAAEKFPARGQDIKKLLAGAKADAAAGKWESANEKLLGARNALGEFEGTAVASSKPWTDLSDGVAAQLKTVGPQYNKLDAARREAAETAAGIALRSQFADEFDSRLLADGDNPDSVTATGKDKTTLAVKGYFCSRQWVHDTIQNNNSTRLRILGFKRLECNNAFQGAFIDL